MQNSFKAFHHSLIDYAGIFPPESLSLDQALANYIEYISCNDSWMLGAFILPASKIQAAAEILNAIFPDKTRDNPLTFSLISMDLKNDLLEFQQFADSSNHEIILSSIETKEANFTETQSKHIIYIEPTSLNALTRVLNIAQIQNQGIKIRCGGVESSMIPSSETIASVIESCTSRAIPMKFTAGLHHPLRHYSEAHGAKLHGFINIFTATMCSRIHQLRQKQICDILNDQSIESFKLNEKGLQWKDLSITTEEIETLRHTQAHSYGSCSFTEPRQDLTELNWM